MDTQSFKTRSIKASEVQPKWWIVDASDQVLGRMSSRITHILRGKHQPFFTPHVNCGDYVIVINAEKVKLTGNKWNDKVYQRFSGYPGGQKERTAIEMLEKQPTQIIHKAVKGMLPKNKLSRQVIKKLFVYTGTEHPHGAQKPEELKLEY